MQKIELLFQALSRAKIISKSPWDLNSIIWHEEGLKLRTKYINLIKRCFSSSNYQEFLFPAIIPKSLLSKQYEHYRDISQISFPLDEHASIYLRSTSESQFASYVSESRYYEEPIKMFQECSVFRKETHDSIIPLLRDIEINPFIESMTYSKDSSLEQNNEIRIYSLILEKLGLPFLKSTRPLWDTFPEAVETIAFDLPIDDIGVFQLASIHNLSSSFTKDFHIKDLNNEYLKQTSSGISGRALFASLIEHFRNPSIFLPTALLPYYIGINESHYAVVKKTLSNNHLNRILIKRNPKDLIDFNPVLPIVIKDIRKSVVQIEKYDGQTSEIKIGSLAKEIQMILSQYDRFLIANSKSRLEKSLRGEKKILQFPSCGNIVCIRMKIEPSINYKILGFHLLDDARNYCDNCKMLESYQTRLENVS
jgi:prolyl-tRNA synthetase